MDSLVLLATILGFHLLAVASPGPDFVMAVRNSLSYGRRAGVWTAVGFGLGIAVHVTYCALGLALLISQSILLFDIIKLAGAAYLVWVGIGAIRARSSGAAPEIATEKSEMSALAAVRSGFVTNVLNPKATLFFLSLFTLLVTPTTPHWVVAVACVMMMVDTALWFSLVAVFFTQERVRAGFYRFEGAINKTFGVLLVALGARIAFSAK